LLAENAAPAAAKPTGDFIMFPDFPLVGLAQTISGFQAPHEDRLMS